VSEAAGASDTLLEAWHDRELELHDGDYDQLRNSLAGLDPKRRAPAVPARDHELTLVVGIDQANEIAEHDTVLMP
jgi:hypothetical protein